MNFLAKLPIYSSIDGDLLDCALWESKTNVCEFKTDESAGECSNTDYFFGTTDEYEPKFCGKHFFELVVSGDGKTNYKLVGLESPEAKAYFA